MKRAILVLAAFFLIAAKNEYVSIDQHSIRFARGDREYVIHDESTVDRLNAIYAPQVQLGREQARLGRKQAALGAQQAEIGRAQASMGFEQAGIRDSSNPRFQELVRMQNELTAQQNKLIEQQNRYTAEQNKMSAKQNELQREAERKAEPILQDAIRSGVAVEVR